MLRNKQKLNLMVLLTSLFSLLGSSVALGATCQVSGDLMTVTLSNETATLRVGAFNAILVNNVPCETASTINIDTIQVTGGIADEGVIIDLGGGRFAPGATPEPTGNSEIEFVIQLGNGNNSFSILGEESSDSIIIGTHSGIGNFDGPIAPSSSDTLINTNTEEDANILVDNSSTSNVPTKISVSGRGDSDVLEGTGFFGTGAVSKVPLNLSGGSGDDIITGGINNDDLFGDDGNDSLFGRDGNDILRSGAGDDQNTGGDGNDVIYAGSGNDLLNGNDGTDTLYGQDGNDELNGQAGTDALFGQAGNDTLNGGGDKDGCWTGSPGISTPGDSVSNCEFNAR